MRTRPVFVLLVVTAAVLVAAFAFRGQGHRALVRWLPAIHGGR